LALPGIFSPGEPQATETVASGPAKIQANNQALADFLGMPQSVQLTSPAFALTTAGAVTIAQPGATVVADPTIGLGIATKQYVDGKALSNVSGTAAGTNTYTATLAPAPANLAALMGVPITVKFSLSNTTAATLNPNGLGATAITINGGAIAPATLVANQYQILVYDGTNFELIGSQPLPAVQRIVKPNDQSVTSSTTLVNDSALLFSVAINETWRFELHLYFVASNAGGVTGAIIVPGGASLVWATGTTASGAGVPFGGGPNLLTLIGIVQTIGTAGTVQFQFAQTASNGTPSTVKALSALVATRLAP
jgi:hypothetical protein